MENFIVEFFEKEDGTFPAEEFILSQELKMKAKIFRMLELLELKGNDLREPYSKKITGNIYELRTSKELILQEFYIFLLWGKKSYLQTVLLKRPIKHQERKLKRR